MSFGVSSTAIEQNLDLFAIKKRGDSGSTEVHVLNAGDNYQSFSLQAATALHPTDDNWAFTLQSESGKVLASSGSRDLFAIKRLGDSGSTEVHVLAASDNYQSFWRQTATALHPTNRDWVFGVAGGWRSLYAIKKRGGDSGSTEVHVLGGGDYQRFSFQTGTLLHPTGDNWAFAVTGDQNLFGIKKNGTDSRSTEVHIVAPPGVP